MNPTSPSNLSFKRALVCLSQLILGLTFIISGLSKCIDPVGSSIKFTEYLLYFGQGRFIELTLGMAWLLSIIETACGVCLLVGYGRARAFWFITLLMFIFTPLTLWLAVTDAIQDCGCFGDAIHLTNWQTFGKNIVLCLLLFVVWHWHHLSYRLLGKTTGAILFYWTMGVCVWFCWMGTWREPLIDFRPYHPGVDLLKATVGDATTSDDYSPASSTYTCIYKLGDVEQEFSLDSIPDESEGWEFVTTIEHPAAVAVSEPTSSPAAIDFFVKNAEGEVLTRQLLQHPGYTLLLLSPSLDLASQHDIDRIEQLWEYATDYGYPFYCITARDEQQYQNWQYNTGAEYDFLFTDASIVETMCRSNPGVMLLHDGYICWKSPLSVLDTKALTSAKLNEQSYGQIAEIDVANQFLFLLILFFGPFPLFLLIEIPKKFQKTNIKKDSKDA